MKYRCNYARLPNLAMLSMAVLSSGLRRASAMAGFTCDPPRVPVIFSSVAAFLLVEPNRASGGREGISRYRAHPSGQSGSVGRERFISFERAFERSFLAFPLDIRCYRPEFLGKEHIIKICSIVTAKFLPLNSWTKRMDSDETMNCMNSVRCFDSG